MLLSYIHLMTNFIFFKNIVGILLQSAKQCVPTATVHGPCHDCVCTAEGMFHCQHRNCTEIDEELKSSEKNCEANYLYRDDTTYCSCSDSGDWQSDNCQEKFQYLFAKKKRANLILRSDVACKSGKLYVVDCNICRCENNGFIELTTCTSRDCFEGHKADPCKPGDYLRTDNEICACSDINVFIDRLCLPCNGSQIYKIENNDISNLVETGNSWQRIEELMSHGCNTEMLYTVDCNSCSCVDSKLVCTTKECYIKKNITLRHGESITGTDKVFKSLLKVQTLKDPCEPGQRYRYKCNLCECSKDGVLDCATMICLEDYVLNENALRGALTLAGDHGNIFTQTCIEGATFRMNCNTCICHRNRYMCTKMACYIPGRHETKLRINRESIESKTKMNVDELANISDEEFLKLPSLPHHASECSSHVIYKVDCNACICDEEGILVCENNMCVDKSTTRQNVTSKKSGKACQQSFVTKDCIMCLCMNATTKCGPVSDCNTKDEVELANVNLDGRSTFDFKKQECIPHVVYKDKCNKCYCQQDKTLRCTRKLCLNYKQAKQLEEEKEYLMEHGL